MSGHSWEEEWLTGSCLPHMSHAQSKQPLTAHRLCCSSFLTRHFTRSSHLASTEISSQKLLPSWSLHTFCFCLESSVPFLSNSLSLQHSVCGICRRSTLESSSVVFYLMYCGRASQRSQGLLISASGCWVIGRLLQPSLLGASVGAADLNCPYASVASALPLGHLPRLR